MWDDSEDDSLWNLGESGILQSSWNLKGTKETLLPVISFSLWVNELAMAWLYRPRLRPIGG